MSVGLFIIVSDYVITVSLFDDNLVESFYTLI